MRSNCQTQHIITIELHSNNNSININEHEWNRLLINWIWILAINVNWSGGNSEEVTFAVLVKKKSHPGISNIDLFCMKIH